MFKNISAKIIIVIVAAALFIGLAVWGYFYFNNNLKKSKEAPEIKILEKAEEAAEQITEEATKGALPSLTTNPLENKPDVNPASKANPIKNIKTNPFE